MITYFYIFLVSLFTSLVLVPPISRLAVHIGVTDQLDERKIHRTEVPRLGGIAIFFGFFLAALLFFDFGRSTRGFLVGGFIVFLTGLADDLSGLTPRKKLIGQTLAAMAVVIMGGVRMTSLGDLFGYGTIFLGVLSVPFTILAMVGVMNAVNLLDGLDGLAAGVVAIASFAFALLAYLTRNGFVLSAAAATVGAVVGFLRYNTWPARIFMGDGGSLFLGYCMGVFSVAVVSGGKDSRISVVAPLLILAVPIMDTLYVMVRRKLAHRPIFSPDRSHLHHRLFELGFGHRGAVIAVYALTYFFCIAAVLTSGLPDYRLLMLALGAAFLLYGALKIIEANPEPWKLRFLQGRWRVQPVVAPRAVARGSQMLRICIKYVLLAILLFAVAAPAPGRTEWGIVAALLLLLLISLLFLEEERSNRFLLFVLYFAGTFIIWRTEALGLDFLVFPFPSLVFPLLLLSHGLFIILFLLEAGEILLRRQPRHLVNSPLEILMFFPLVSVPLLPEQIIKEYHLLTVGAKSVVLIVAYKLILMREASRNRKLIAATAVALLAIALRNFR